MAAVTAMAIAAGVGAVGQIAGGAIGAGKAGKAARKASDQISQIEASRQDIIDPSGGLINLSSQATNVYAGIGNPAANLTVSTKAAEFQAEQSDMSLASALDNLRATGSGSGGATAIAQAALQSKAGIAADIAQQESANAQLRVQGEQQRQMAVAQGESQLQSIRISEGQRIQQGQMQGAQWSFNAQESRDMQQLNRLAGQESNYQQQQANAQSQMWGGIGSLAGAAASFGSSGGSSSNDPFPWTYN